MGEFKASFSVRGDASENDVETLHNSVESAAANGQVDTSGISVQDSEVTVTLWLQSSSLAAAIAAATKIATQVLGSTPLSIHAEPIGG